MSTEKLMQKSDSGLSSDYDIKDKSKFNYI